MSDRRVHGFVDDVLADHDAVELARMVRTGEVTPVELAAAAAARAARVEPQLHAIAHAAFDHPRLPEHDPDHPRGALHGVPTFVKDNTDVAGMPTNHGSDAFRAPPARRDGRYTRRLLSTGMTVLGKSRMPEFGFSATTEFNAAEPTRNPWNTDHSSGASSGGAAALVSSGVVPIAHGNDGAGSLRIPAACTGSVGFKLSRGRHIDGEQARMLPLKIITEGVITRTVRDTATFVTAMDRFRRNPTLPPIPDVVGPSSRRLRVGVILETTTGAPIDVPTRAAVDSTAGVLDDMGHVVESVASPFDEQVADDFVQYWALLADLAASTGRLRYGNAFDAGRLDGLTLGLHRRHRRNWHKTPGALYRLRRAPQTAARMFAHYDVVLSPVLAHTAPELGFLSPTVEFDKLIERLIGYVAFTPPHNLAGIPGLSLPAGLSESGVPVGVQLSGSYGDEQTLLELGFELEAARPFPRIASGRSAGTAGGNNVESP